MSARPEPASLYLKVYGILIGLTLLTTATAFLDLGILTVLVTILIAGLKMMLVLLFFMHLRHAGNLTRVFLFGGIFWLALLIGLITSDLVTRKWDATDRPPSWLRRSASHFLPPAK